MSNRLVAIAVVVSCGCAAGSGPHALFTLTPPTQPIAAPTATLDFYSLPFPNDLRLRADGTIDLSTYPPGVGVIADYLATIGSDPAGGFATQGAVFFRLDGPLDAAALPDPAATMQPRAAAFLVDITPGSPTYDRHTPVQVHFNAGGYDFIGPNWLALLPLPGLPLRERTTYAAVLTDGLRGPGGALRAAADFVAAKSGAAGRPYAPLVAWLAAHPELAPHVVDAAVFTTRDATSILPALRAAVYAQAPAPTLDNLKYDGRDPSGVADVYEGTYAAPIFQSGDAPYFAGGGTIGRDATGAPRVQKLVPVRVALTVPVGAMPAGGWPVVLYEHGTGGDYSSFVRDGSAAAAARVSDGAGHVLAEMAMLGFDAVENGARVPAGTDNDLAFFDFLNLPALHDNVLQGAADGFQVVRLIHAVAVAAAPVTGQPLKLDPSRILFKGHSQGGLTGPLFLAAEPEVRAAVLSGAGGDLIYSLLDKTEPRNIPVLVQSFLHDPLDAYHPLLSLVQGYFDDADPVNYARRLFAEPLPGVAPKSIFQSLGVVDHYTPIPTLEALAVAMGVQPIAPEQLAFDDEQLRSIVWGTAPVSMNVSNGAATGVLLEYPAAPGRDGHFVVFDDAAAVAQSNRFLASALAGGAARLDPP